MKVKLEKTQSVIPFNLGDGLAINKNEKVNDTNTS